MSSHLPYLCIIRREPLGPAHTQWKETAQWHDCQEAGAIWGSLQRLPTTGSIYATQISLGSAPPLCIAIYKAGNKIATGFNSFTPCKMIS